MKDTDRETIDRYLAGKLTESEDEAVETRIVSDPRFRREFELSCTMREGLAELDARGELAPLLRSPPFWQRPLYAIAASVAVLAAAGTGLLLVTQSRPLREQATLTPASPAATLAEGTRTQLLRLAQTRSASDEPHLIWRTDPEVDRLELRLDAGYGATGSHALRIERVGAGGDVLVLELPAVVPVEEEIIASVNAGLFPPGDYRLTLTPSASGTASTLRLRVE